jgi:hypothetical protein
MIKFTCAIVMINCLFFSLGAAAEIYKCDVGGKLVMQDMPCPDETSQTTVEVVIQNDNSKKYSAYKPKPYDPSEFNDFENQLIQSNRVEVGMSVKALEYSWGTVKNINRSAFGPEQWVFRVGAYGKYRYAYVKDGVVVNWQD